MKKIYFYIVLGVCCIALPATVHAQYQELGLMGGVGIYFGDLNPNYTNVDEIHPGGGLVYRYNFTDRVALKANLLYTRVEAWDATATDEQAWQQFRNLHFRSDIIELSAQAEINFLTYEIGDRKRPSSAYLFLGMAIFNMNPQALYEDEWIDLQPLGTEGQGLSGYDDQYNLTQFAIPFGAGFKFNIWGNLGGAVEFGFRKTFTDYLDDVSTIYVERQVLETGNGPLAYYMSDRSLRPLGADGTNANMQRGETNRKDWYTFSALMLTWKLGKPRIKCPSAY